ncbi:serine protease [Bradyrhizobium lablabi]|uniref:serine protease n=1 Tax=Bradyrhizobium lablabi TaxID=722472 RepID=UPI001BAB58CD|nr:serine protease [Bradyrhizobium lablabi]MBR0696249.1 serine protease [Bradyrhizobium lablabi]
MSIKLACVLAALSSLACAASADAESLMPRGPRDESAKKIVSDLVAQQRKLLPKIVGGTDAKPGEFPHQIGFLAKDDNGHQPGINRFFCAGSIISNQWVLTAAHCVVGMVAFKELIAVGAGSIDLNKLEEFDIDEIWVHPRYSDATHDYDFALVKIRASFPDREIPVVTRSDNQFINEGDVATITGWGAVEPNGQVQQFLRKADVKIISRSDCNDANSYDGKVTARMICLGVQGGGKDACAGDSGGPALARGQGGTRVLFADTSWGEGCAAPEKYGVYGRIISVRAWLDLVTNGEIARLDRERRIP